MADWAVLNRSDPAPGDVEGTRALGRRLLNQAATVEQETARLRSLASSSGDLKMAGDYAAEYTATLSELPDDLSKLGVAYRGCGNALTRFAEDLSVAKSKAKQALSDGVDADTRYRSALQDLKSLLPPDQQGLASNGLSLSPSAVDAATVSLDENTRAQIRHAASRARTADSDLDRARTLADQAAALRGDAEDRAERGINDSLEGSGIKNKSWAQKAWDTVSKPFRSWDDFVSLCGTVALVAGVAALFISGPIGWALMAAALVAGAVVFGDSLVKYANGEVGLGTVALNALGLIPGGRGVVSLTRFGRALGPLGKALTSPGGFRVLASTAGKGLRNLATAFPHALSTAGGGIRSALANPKLAARAFACRFLGRDPIDMVSGEMVMQMTDFELPALLPIVLERTYASSYGVGRWFGPSWSSFLDQRLEVDAQGVCFAYTEAVLLTYPSLAPGESALPDEGPRVPLTRRSDGHYSITEPDTGRTFWFAPPPAEGHAVLPLAAVSDRNSNRIDLGYDPSTGWLAEITHTGGYRVHVECQDGHITEFRLAGRDGSDDTTIIRYGYDDRGRLTDVINSSGLPLKFGYDRHHRITSWTDRNGTWYRYTYDGAGRVIRTAGSAHCLDGQMRYDTENRVTVEVNSLGAQTAYHYNEDGQVVRVVDARGQATRHLWDRYHRKTGEVDPLGRSTRFDYDENDDLIRVVRPDGASFRSEYDERHRVVRYVEPDGSAWGQEFDQYGNVRAVTDPLGAVTTFSYDATGAMRRRVDPLGRVTEYTVDTAGLALSFTDALGNATGLERDAFGRVTALTDARGNTTRYQWTVEGRIARETLPDGVTRSWGYDAENNLVEYVDPMGGSSTTEYTSFDLPSVRTDAIGGRLVLTYDTELRLTSVTDPRGLVWRYEYDACGAMLRETDYDGRVLTYRRDAVGHVIGHTNAVGETVEMAYDELGNLVSRRGGGENSTFRYDAMSRLLLAANQDSQVEFVRDRMGRVLAETVDGRTVESRYDRAGHRVQRRSPSGATSVWQYDRAGRPAVLTLGEQRVSFSYDADGSEIERRHGHAVMRQAWSASGQLLGQAVDTLAGAPATDTAVQRRVFGYDRFGRLTDEDDTLRGVRRYELDPLDRVVAVHDGGAKQEQYTYDAGGSLAGAGTAWVFEGSHLRATADFSYEYDAQGRLSRRVRRDPEGQEQTWFFRWNVMGRMTSVVTSSGERWRYTYDALGRRTSKQLLAADGAVERAVVFSWDGNALVEAAERAGAAKRVTTWEWHPDDNRPLIQSGDDRCFSIVTDFVGTPTELVTPDGAVAWQSGGNLWGLQSGDTEQLCPLGFPGQYRDTETGLLYNQQRYYDPAGAVYVSPDPLGIAPDVNPYAYVPNPLTWVDPLGLAPYQAPKVPDPFAVRVQAQGGGLEKSVVLSKTTPVTVEEALEAMKNLKGQLSKKELKERAEFFARAEKWIRNAPKGGGVSPMGKTFNLHTPIRVDIEILRGLNLTS
ncbi:RHS repeat-associated core domain-containing protein [Kineosporia sp. NBRC 101731]|uniref:RHS repeat-associated core domain-containing protein n=1 Tax=Kineosporia sp. NBRC 101731 TaxID=3032199 RepID=UPI0024A4EE1A|nr:RHS repeat-associated core domain-containing protein [Kineosporia sp. NBRC 101731]GLY29100.1 hypothetical protein Kisp02_24650 [Kineosporia sp. NBRC 101731]